MVEHHLRVSQGRRNPGRYNSSYQGLELIRTGEGETEPQPLGAPSETTDRPFRVRA